MGTQYTVTPLKPGRFRIYDPLGVHMDLFVGSEKALLWDTGYGMGDLAGCVRELTQLPLIIVNSHGHADHACGNYQFEESIFIHPKDIPVCEFFHSEYRKNIAVNYARGAHDFFTGEPLQVIDEAFDVEAYMHRLMGNLKPIEEGAAFDLGGIRLEIVELPGHTPGSIGLMDIAERTLYAADAMNDNLWLFFDEACPLSVYRKTLDKAWALDFDRLVISHSPMPLDKNVLKDYMDVADHLDYSAGAPFSAPLAPDSAARICVRPGYTTKDAGKPGYASIVISESKLC